MLIQEHLTHLSALIEENLSALVRLKECPYEELFLAARYSLLAGGKRLRPLLALVTAEMLGSDPKKAVIAACTLEMIHTYSLIHDDLPCMDDDDFRRGKPSLHKAFNEGLAVLTGDYLLTSAFDILSSIEDLDPSQRLALISVLAKKSGEDGMIAGQVMDIASNLKKIDVNFLQEIHMRKTGMLIAASLEFGAIIAKAEPVFQETLKEFGLKIGLAFQIVDDILDVTASYEKHGKHEASDLVNGKTTYVSLLGLEGSKQFAESVTNEALKLLNSLPFDTSVLSHLARALVNRKL